ncbi:XK-related protein 9 [Conger conger]|uniref:XK-related protein 9 n=1 Tax=Conger conger TaxID=82655 RepID=UPI002A5A621B|nr:XK-related protein 9 [Conger conger]XP_061095977.1 XK-related protein 9 [Conger conger]XP_061095978.1 XK-related protein 9 [Conger conger]
MIIPAKEKKEMPEPNSKFTLLRYILATVGIILYIVDTGTDIWVAVQYYADKCYGWFALTIFFVLAGSLVPQIFSYAWFRDDGKIDKRKRTQLIFIHILQLGVFTRYFQLLKKGVGVIQSSEMTCHHEMFGMAADLTMLRLIETFVESAPQLLLQIYIILGPDQDHIMQYLSVAASFFSIAWATVEYRRSFRRSVPHVKEMPSGLPTAVYLSYKLFTIASHILSLSLLVMLDRYCTSVFAILWLCGTIWAYKCETDFCTSRSLEWFYRGIVGVILIFTFFNVKGKNTAVVMTVYYGLYTCQSLAVLLLFYFLKSLPAALLPVALVITGSKLAGLICLCLYYAFLHPKSNEQVFEMQDEVDGLMAQRCEPDSPMTSSERRRKAFLQY